MDLWIVAAAAGAGYVVKDIYLKNSPTREREHPLESLCSHSAHGHLQSCNILQQVREITCPLCRLAATKKTSTDGSSDRDFIRFPSSSNFFNICNESIPEFTKEVSPFPTLTGSIHVRHGSSANILKLDSSESCCLQLYAKQTRFDDRITLLAVPPYTDVVRPLAGITQSKSRKRQDGLLLLRKLKRSANAAQTRRSSRSITRVYDDGPFSSQGLSNGMVLFFLGITMGLMSANAATEGEINNLNELLQQMENLAQDLHDDIKMKDQLTVKELHSQESGTQGTTEDPTHIGVEPDSIIKQGFNETTRSSGKESPENSETMSKIEAELEAELERLEMDMKSSSLQRVLNSFEGHDSVENAAQGDSELDKMNDQPDRLSESDNHASGTSTDHLHTENYAVSPVELSLRLHEVIQSRLAMRIMELEAELENSQKRLRALHSVTTIPYSDVESSSTNEEPTIV